VQHGLQKPTRANKNASECLCWDGRPALKLQQCYRHSHNTEVCRLNWVTCNAAVKPVEAAVLCSRQVNLQTMVLL